VLRGRITLAAALILALASPAAAQGHPTGACRGQVTDPNDLPVPGVTVTVSSPALQGTRVAVTSPNGDFIIPFLPPGDYSVTFDLAGFESQRHMIRVEMAETLPLRIRLALAGVAETVQVTAADSTGIGKTAGMGETFTAVSLERLPLGRTLTDAVLLAPGVTPNGPLGRIVISGALSYENLFLIDGVASGDFLGQPLPLYIEDAIQETKVSRGSISAEYGRFQGGVVNMITKSGGNTFSGSFRISLANDAWRALTPYPADRTISSLTPTFEVTGGGPIRRDKVWFFGAGRFTNPQRNVTLDFTHVNYVRGTDDRRGEGKLTYALNRRNTLKASYTKRALATKNNSLPNVMDLASLFDDRSDFSLSVINYTSVLSDHIFLEGQYSKKLEVMTGSGSRFSDLVKGTPIADRSRGLAHFNSPTRCNVCGGGWLQRLGNQDWFVKLNYFLSTTKAGSHSLVAGFDSYRDGRKNNNWQSGSGYVIQATTTIIDGSAIYPVFRNDNSTHINYFPLVAESVGNDVRTYSAFVNDVWRYNAGLSLNVGYRYDQHRAKDQTGLPVINAATFSPRVGLSWDVSGDGKWRVDTGFARYVMGLFNLVVDAASPGGRTANYSYLYQGPPINTGAGPYLTADQALRDLFDWFFANGGLNRITRNAPVIPGLTRHIGGDMTAPNSHEYSVGVTRDIRKAGNWRVDYLYRTYHDMYGDFLDTTTGHVRDPATGRRYDLAIVRNNSDARRTYRGLTASFTYRLPSLQVGGNYTLSWSRGNVDGEGVSTAFFRTMIGTYPEYRQGSWNFPFGYAMNDQRHKVRAWFSYSVPVPENLGRMNVGFLQRFDSALPYDAKGEIDSSPYVTNPGYVTPPASVTYYFSPRFGLRWDDSWATDLSVNWSKKMPQLRTTEVVFRAVVTNVLNNAAVVAGDSTILTRIAPGGSVGLQRFNPFTEVPVRGAHWMYGPAFGQPTGTGDYQAPRTFNCSAGIRF
jgi:hypothetical protein